jgi:N-acetylglucosamine kinase
MVMEALNAHTLAELFQQVHDGRSIKAVLASVAPVVDRAALAGDRLALGILRHASRSLFHAVATVVSQLRLAGQPFSVVLIGGVLQNSAVIRERLVARITGRYHHAEVLLLDIDAAAGAAQLARDDVRMDIWSCYERPIASEDPGPSSESGGR